MGAVTHACADRAGNDPRDDAVPGRAIRGEGTPEQAWRPWLASLAVPRMKLPGSGPRRLVVVAPHPDDEVLACGGLLSLCASLGLAPHVIAVTDGAASHGECPPGAAARLAGRRTLESDAGLRVLGVPPSGVVRLGVPDGQAACHSAGVADRLQAMLRPGDTVVTTWRLDGHPDHEATGAAAAQAARAVGCALLQAPVWMWHWAQPGDPRVPWRRLVRLDLPAPALAAKQVALRMHVSQFEDRGGGLGPVLVPNIVARAARHAEYFFA